MEQQDLLSWTPPSSDRFGSTYDAAFDFTRLNAQQARVWEVVKDGKFHTLAEISARTGDPEASVSARLRDLRNMHGCKVDRRRQESGGTYEYAVRRPREVNP